MFDGFCFSFCGVGLSFLLEFFVVLFCVLLLLGGGGASVFVCLFLVFLFVCFKKQNSFWYNFSSLKINPKPDAPEGSWAFTAELGIAQFYLFCPFRSIMFLRVIAGVHIVSLPWQNQNRNM